MGVGSPERERLADADGITAGMVDAVASQVRASGGGVGLIVNRLRENVERASNAKLAATEKSDARAWWATLDATTRKRWANTIRANSGNAALPTDHDCMPGWAWKAMAAGGEPSDSPHPPDVQRHIDPPGGNGTHDARKLLTGLAERLSAERPAEPAHITRAKLVKAFAESGDLPKPKDAIA